MKRMGKQDKEAIRTAMLSMSDSEALQALLSMRASYMQAAAHVGEVIDLAIVRRVDVQIAKLRKSLGINAH